MPGRAAARLTDSGLRIIDDSYNANPLSMCAAVDILAGFSGRTLLVLGDMGELGEWAEQGHRQVGAYASGKVDGLYAVGPLMKTYIDYPPRKLQSEGYDGPLTLSAYEKFQSIRESLAKDGFKLSLPSGN